MKGIIWLLAVICIALWLLGLLPFIAGMAKGNLIHILLIIAVISI